MEDLPRPHRFTVKEFHRMAEVGLLAPDARVELIEGRMIDIAPREPAHIGTVAMLDELLHEAVGNLALILCQGSIVLGEYSEPRPDLAVLRPRADFYRTRHATAATTLLVIEVSDTTWRYDRLHKVPLYARQGIPEVWLVDLPHSTLHFFRAFSGETYADESQSKVPGIIAIPGVPGATVDLSALFAPWPDPEGAPPKA